MLDCNQDRGVSKATRQYQAAIAGVPDCTVAKRRFMESAEKLFDLYWRVAAQPDSKAGAVSCFCGLPGGHVVRIRLSSVECATFVEPEGSAVEGG